MSYVVRLVVAMALTGVIATPTALAASEPVMPIVGNTSIGNVTADTATIDTTITTADSSTTYKGVCIGDDRGIPELFESEVFAAGGSVEEVDTSVTIEGLEPRTSYLCHIMVYAHGEEFTSSPSVQVSTKGAPTIAIFHEILMATSANINGNVDIYGEDTTVQVEYGTTESYGASTEPELFKWSYTPLVQWGDKREESAKKFNFNLVNLLPNTLYHYRVAAVNATGKTYSEDHTLRVWGSPTSSQTPSGSYNIRTRSSKAKVVWGDGVTITGTVTRTTDRIARRVPIRLEMQTWPYDKPFQTIGKSNADTGSTFSLKVPHMRASGMLRIATDGAIAAVSPATYIAVAPKIAVRARRLSGGRVQVSGTVQPGLPQGRASLQRMAGAGKWRQVQRVSVKGMSGNRSSYRFRALKGEERTRRYRVVVSPRRGSPIVVGNSRTISVRGRR